LPRKEALVVDEDGEQRAELGAVDTNRAPGVSLARAFHDHLRDDLNANLVGNPDLDDRVRRFWELIDSTPALNGHGQRMWLRHEDAISAASATQFGLVEPGDRIRAFARFVLKLALLAGTADDRLRMLDAGFDILDHPGSTYETQHTTR
jgi:hypothetical protein